MTDSPRWYQRIAACLFTSAWFALIYNFTNWLTAQRSDLGLAAFAWEQQIPFVPWLIIPYWSIDLFYVLAPFIISSKDDLCVYVRRIFWAVSLAGICFILFPLQLNFMRPPVSGILGHLFASLDNFNNFYNLAPSLHITLRTILWMVFVPRCSGLSAILLRVWFVLIGVSTLFTWQHHVIDVFFGYILGCAVVQFVRGSQDPNQGVCLQRQQNGRLDLGIGYILLSLAFSLVGALTWLPGFVLFWPAASFMVIALAYLGLGPWVFGTQNHGCAKFIFFPYRQLSTLVQSWFLKRLPLITKVSDNVHFGPIRKMATLQNAGYHTVLHLAPEYPATPQTPSVQLFSIPVLDLTRPSLVQLNQAVNFISERLASGPIYIQCALGLGRSALVSAAWLLASKQCSNAESASAAIRRLNPRTIFGSRELALLNEFATTYHPEK